MTDSKDVISVAKDIVDREMVIKPEDTEAVKKFFEHFSIKMPKELKKSLDAFKKDPNLKTQKKFVIEVNRAISGEHSIETLDEMFKPIVECAKETAYDLEFSDEMTDLLKEESNLNKLPSIGLKEIEAAVEKGAVTPEESQSSSEQEPSDS